MGWEDLIFEMVALGMFLFAESKIQVQSEKKEA